MELVALDANRVNLELSFVFRAMVKRRTLTLLAKVTYYAPTSTNIRSHVYFLNVAEIICADF